MEKEIVHIQTRKSDKVLCGLPANMWLTAMLDSPVEDFCPACLVELLAYLTKSAPTRRSANSKKKGDANV